MRKATFYRDAPKVRSLFRRSLLQGENDGHHSFDRDRLTRRFYDQFKQEHAAFSMKVDDFAKKFQKGQLGISIELMDFLSDWLGKHIKGTDKKYSALFNANGLK